MFVIRGVSSREVPLVQQFRAAIYATEGLEDPAVFVDGRYGDPDDGRGHHVAAFTVDGVMVGAFKITPRDPRLKMRMESYWSYRTLRLSRAVRAAELSRLAVAPAYRRSGISLGLWRAVYRRALALGVTEAYSMQRPASLLREEALGLPVERLARPVVIHRHEYTPARISVSRVVSGLFAVSPAIAGFFSSAEASEDGVFDPHDGLSPPRLERFAPQGRADARSA